MALALTALHLALLFIAASFFVAAAVTDVRSYRIPNYICGLFLLAFPAYVLTSPGVIEWHQNLIVFAVVSMLGFGVFLGNLAGAGDIKLLSVAALWAGPHYIAALLIVTAFVGGIEALVVATGLHLRFPKIHRFRLLPKAQIPYGVAIAAGGIAMLGMMAHPILQSE